MRDRMYRAWDTVTNKIICEGFHILGEVTVMGMFDEYIHDMMQEKPRRHDCSISYLNDILIEDWIGKYDSAGKPIYEGDKITNVYDPSCPSFPIEWNEEDCSFNINFDSEYQPIDSTISEWGLVSGNIHE